MDEDVDARERLFHNVVREYIVRIIGGTRYLTPDEITGMPEYR